MILRGLTDRQDTTFGFLFDVWPKTIQMQYKFAVSASSLCLLSPKSTFKGALLRLKYPT